MIRSVTIPVGVPVGLTWQELRAGLVPAFRASTLAANWTAQQLYRRDTLGQAKTPDAVKPGSAEKGQFSPYAAANTCTKCGRQRYDSGTAPKDRKTGAARPACGCPAAVPLLYPDMAAWAGAKGSLNVCLRAAHRKYLLHRFDVCVRFKQGLLTYKYPFPYPVPGAAYELGYTAEAGTPSGSAFPTVSLPLPGLGRVTLRLKRSRDLARQLARFRYLVDHPEARQEAAVYEKDTGSGKVLMVKLVGDFPPPPQVTDPQHAMLLRTDPAAFLVAEVDGRRPWIFNCDHLRRRQAAHKAYLQRAGEDKKREKRMDRRQRRDLREAVGARCRKHGDRLDHAVREVTNQIVRFCQRQKVGVVVFDDAVRTYFGVDFPWAKVADDLARKLTDIGVRLVTRAAAPSEELASWLTDRSLPAALRLAEATTLAAKRLVRGAAREGPHPAVTPPAGKPAKKAPPRGRSRKGPSTGPSSPPAGTS